MGQGAGQRARLQVVLPSPGGYRRPGGPGEHRWQAWGNGTCQPSDRWAATDSPTMTQADRVTQETAVSGSATWATVARRHAEPEPPPTPVRIATPAWDAEATVVPTATQGPAAHDRPSRSAAVDSTGADTHEPPPLPEVSTTLWPARAPPRTVDVVPTAVHEFLVPPVVPEVQSMPWSAPVPAGTCWSVHVVPPSDVAAMTPTTWSTSIDWVAVAQQ